MDKVEMLQIWANGSEVIPPADIIPGKVWVKANLLKTDFGLSVKYEYNALYITLPASYVNSTCGLCADTETPTDQSAEGSQTLNDAPSFWNCSGSDEMVSYLCGMLINVDGPFRECHGVPDSNVYYLCLTQPCPENGDISANCQVVQDYVVACQNLNQTIKPWRNDSFCPPSCPVNSHYSLCANPCKANCSQPDTTSYCNAMCTEGCECDDGFYGEDGNCIPKQACGCNVNGSYYQMGSVTVGEGCQQMCSCDSFEKWTCWPHSCDSDEVCEVRSGVRECYWAGFLCPEGSEYSNCTSYCDTNCMNSSCLPTCMEGCMCQDGLLWDGFDCVTEEQCLGNANKLTFSQDLNCETSLISGISSSLCPLCTINSLSITSLQNVSRKLEENVTYEIFRICGSLEKPWLRILLHTQHPSNRLHVFFDNRVITVDSNLDVLVNGTLVSFPLNVPPGLVIDHSDGTVTFTMPGEMAATFNLFGQLTVTVSVDFIAYVCGACAYGGISQNGTDYLLDCCKAADFN
ncbi:hypothetical protein GDO86_012146 [Hymenochirus boettgeri]|uniref:VWF/SSPO/Zonadhesin-like cysteine-rich domain-containing protein n=1 Tax=Hymenochirus boettgeri TaxID=247094 RepID=A0A8T2ITC8_9PIPI|nr:hypothetical protein GDO86_012146 [Hymenochirus boettgeri]